MNAVIWVIGASLIALAFGIFFLPSIVSSMSEAALSWLIYSAYFVLVVFSILIALRLIAFLRLDWYEKLFLFSATATMDFLLFWGVASVSGANIAEIFLKVLAGLNLAEDVENSRALPFEAILLWIVLLVLVGCVCVCYKYFKHTEAIMSRRV